VRRLAGLLAASLLAVAPAGGADAFETCVAWRPPDVVVEGARSRLDLVFSDCEPEGSVLLPPTNGIKILGDPSESRSFRMENFKSSSEVVLSFPIRGVRPGRHRIKGFQVLTDEGGMLVRPIEVRVARDEEARAAREQALQESVLARLRLPGGTSVYAGEVVPVELLVGVMGQRRGEILGDPYWALPGVAVEEWGEGERVPLQGGPGMRFRTRLLAGTPGRLELPSLYQKLRIHTGRSRGFFPFQRPEVKAIRARTDPVVLQVRALPDGAPAGFDGAVGEFELHSKIVPEAVAVGEPVTWTLSLEGEGNWPSVRLPGRSVPGHLRVVEPGAQREFEPGRLFTGAMHEELVLIPTREGTLRLPPVRFAWFDPERERYETARVDPPVVRVRAAAAPGPAPARRGPAPAAAASPTAAPALLPPPQRLPGPRSPASLPRPPAPGAGGGSRPWPFAGWLGLLTLPAVALLALWGRLAWARARALDPEAERAAAIRSLPDAVEAVRRAGDARARRQAVVAWQAVAARALGLASAQPTAAEVAARVRAGLAVQGDQAWSELWRRSERAAFAADPELDTRWCDDALAAARALRGPGRPFGQLLRPAAWWGLALALGLAAPAARAADSEAVAAAYAEGDFARAERGAAERVAEEPLDWVARSQLALALAQRDRSAEALPHAVAAWLQRPREDATQWNLRWIAARAGRIDPAVARLLDDGARARLARMASPAGWQRGGLAAATLACVGLGALVHARHRRRRPPRAAAAAALAGGVGLGVALLALSAWGELADPRAAVLGSAASLRSVPTEAVEQAERRLEPGLLVTEERRFLGWSEVRASNGDRGWLRSDGLTLLYAAPPGAGGAAVESGDVGPAAGPDAPAATPAPEVTRGVQRSPPEAPSGARRAAPGSAPGSAPAARDAGAGALRFAARSGARPHRSRRRRSARGSAPAGGRR